MLGDVIKKGRNLESRMVQIWKARNEEENIRRKIIKLFMLPESPNETAQQDVDMERERAYTELEETGYKYLIARYGPDSLMWRRAQNRAMGYASWIIIKLQSVSPEPLHPYLDIPKKWMHEEEKE